MKKEILYEKIERYLEDKLEGKELQDFEVELKNNSELASEVALHRELEAALTDDKAINFEKKMIAAFDEAKQANRQFSDDKATEEKTSLVISMRRYIAIAASVLILIVAGVFLYQNRDFSNTDYTALINDSADYPTTISGNIYNAGKIRDNITEEQVTKIQEKIDKQWLSLKQAYQNKDLETSKSLLQELTPYQKYLDQSYFLYIKGITHLQLGEAQQAYEVLSKSKPTSIELQNSVQWYRAIAALQLDTEREKEVGKELLETIANGTSSYQQSANRLLQKLK